MDFTDVTKILWYCDNHMRSSDNIGKLLFGDKYDPTIEGSNEYCETKRYNDNFADFWHSLDLANQYKLWKLAITEYN